jgi:hypothetical protein
MAMAAVAAAPLASAVTRAMEFYVDKVWIDGVSQGLDQVFPRDQHGLLYAILYAFALTMIIVVVKQGVDYLLRPDRETEKYYNHVY